MRFPIHSLVAVLVAGSAFAGAAVACSSSSGGSVAATDAGKDGTGSSFAGSSSGSSSGSGSGSDSGSSGGGPCTLSGAGWTAGTYTDTATAAATNSAACPTAAQVSGTTEYDGGAGTVTAGMGCTETCNGETITDNCTTDAGATQNISLTLTSTGGTGTATLTAPNPDGGVISCSYTLDITM